MTSPPSRRKMPSKVSISPAAPGPAIVRREPDSARKKQNTLPDVQRLDLAYVSCAAGPARPDGKLKRNRRRRPDLKQQFGNETARSTGGLLPGKELARNLSELAPQRLPDVLVADSAGRGDLMILLTHQRPSQGDSAPPGGLSTRWIGSALMWQLMPPAESGRGSRCVRRRKWAARKRRMPSFAPHPSTADLSMPRVWR
jgi:hypothetical protein